MSAHFILLTQSDLGQALADTAQIILDESDLPLSVIRLDDPPQIQQLQNDFQDLRQQFPQCYYVLLAECYGSTACNFAQQLLKNTPSYQQDTRLLAGVNLPLLLRVLNYRDESLDNILSKAIEGGQNSIREV